MGITRLPSGRFRLQVRRVGWPTVDQVFDTHPEAVAAQAAVLRERQGPAQDHGVTVLLAWERYRQSREFLAKAEHTRRTEQVRIKPVLEHLGHYAMATLADHPELLSDYLDQRAKTISKRTGRPPSPSSLRLELAALAALGRWCVQRRIVLRNPAKGIERPGLSKRRRRVPPEEAAGLTDAAAQKADLMLAEAARFALLCGALGCRPGELAELLRADVDFSRRQVLFRDTKNGTDRMAHLPQAAVDLLNTQVAYGREAAPDGPFVFSTAGKARGSGWKPYNYSGATARLRSAGAVPRGWHLHAMRREFVSRAIEAGLPYSVIRKQTGHKSTQAVEIYDEGLSTAPGVRAALDGLAAEVAAEHGEAWIRRQAQALGVDAQALEQFLKRARGEPGPASDVLADGTVVPIKPRAVRRD